jgi:hypothetical protein
LTHTAQLLSLCTYFERFTIRLGRSRSLNLGQNTGQYHKRNAKIDVVRGRWMHPIFQDYFWFHIPTPPRDNEQKYIKQSLH